MRIVVIGATGTIGRAVAEALTASGHEVVAASRSGAVRVDLADHASIEAMFAAVSTVDVVVSCAASTALAPPDAEVPGGLDAKLLGQVELVRQAARHLSDGGSVTLTSGRFDQPLRGAAFGALVNSGLEAFVRTAAAELPRGLRLNAVSPGWVAETQARLGMAIDAIDGTPVAEVARAYVDAVESTRNGEVLSPRTAAGST
jgi:NAD(P)-dependent dehydrogenase (short-subunit alcohol dehydrogenase family)